MIRTDQKDSRYLIRLSGVVQGVGFRPFVYRLARELGLRGSVFNSGAGLLIDAEGSERDLTVLLRRLDAEKPAAARVAARNWNEEPLAGYRSFEIRRSRSAGAPTAWLAPDLATCSDCLAELRDPAARRYRYPFTNCSACGPRFTIVESLPYDRRRTTMRTFRLCAECESEYRDPADRRFHAEPIACPACGPRLAFLDGSGGPVAAGEEALASTATLLREGGIAAVKGIGGYHLMVDARSGAGVARLRRLKQREEKPFAILLPDLASLLPAAEVSTAEAELLSSPGAPIVLLRRHAAASIAEEVAPGTPYLGVMLASNPLHHLLLDAIRFPVVATSGNLADEPLCTGEPEALARLVGIADGFLVHDRPIARHADDSLVRIVAGRPLFLRRGRGFAPFSRDFPGDLGERLAVGGHLKNAVALARGRHVVVSQHIGDLGTAEAGRVFRRTLDDLKTRHGAAPRAVAADAHPDYASTRFAGETALPVVRVWHHHAHVLSCLADNETAPPVLGVAWDGAGLGPDGSLWGGEFLAVDEFRCRRVGNLLPFPLPGGDAAARDGRRVAFALLHTAELPGRDLGLSEAEVRLLTSMLRRGARCSLTSSAGRLFDGVAALLGIRSHSAYEGHAALALELAAESGTAGMPYPFVFRDGILDWRPLLRELLDDRDGGIPVTDIARRFHDTLVEAIVAVAGAIGERTVALAGGCFQNRLLLEGAVRRLREAGFRPLWPRDLPPGDGGLALGQLVGATLAEGGPFPCA